MKRIWWLPIIAFSLGLVILFFVWLISLAPKPMTNEEIVRQTKICEQSGLKVSTAMNMLTYDVVGVHCYKDE